MWLGLRSQETCPYYISPYILLQAAIFRKVLHLEVVRRGLLLVDLERYVDSL